MRFLLILCLAASATAATAQQRTPGNPFYVDETSRYRHGPHRIAMMRLDLDQDGYLSLDEVKNDQNLLREFLTLDVNHDGLLEPAELPRLGGFR